MDISDSSYIDDLEQEIRYLHELLSFMECFGGEKMCLRSDQRKRDTSHSVITFGNMASIGDAHFF